MNRKMMKYVMISSNQPLLEWKEYYFSKQILKQLLLVKKKIIDEINPRVNIKNTEEENNFTQVMLLDIMVAQLGGQKPITKNNNNDAKLSFQLMKKIDDQVKKIDKVFLVQLRRENQICRIFIQYLTLDLSRRFQRCIEYWKILDLKDQKVITLTENLYIQVYYVKKTIALNLQKLQNFINEQKHFLSEYINEQVVRIKRIYKLIKKINYDQLEKLEDLLIPTCKQKASKLINFKDYLGLNPKNLNPNNYIILFCFWFGFWFGILMNLIFYRSLKLKDKELGTSFETNFPIWRGSCIMILYSWSLGFVFYLLDYFKINYRLVLSKCFEMDPKYFSPNWIIFVTSLTFLSIFVLLFGLYTLQQINFIHTSLGFHWAGILWLVILGYLFLPLPILNYKIRFNVIKEGFKTLIVLFLRTPHMFIFITEQAVSLGQLYTDFAFTVCKYRNYQSKCTQVPLIGSIIIGVMFIYRIITNLKFAYLTKVGYFSGPYFGTARAFLALNTVIAAYVHRVFDTPTSKACWIVLASLTGILAWYTDVKFDWGLFSWQKGSRLIRPNLCLQKAEWVYYLVIILGLILRLTWVLSLFPTLPKQLNIFPFYFLMFIAFLQIFRRGFWNFFRFQFEQSKLKSPFLDNLKLQSQIDELYYELQGKKLLNSQVIQQTNQFNKYFEETLIELINQRKNSKIQVEKFISLTQTNFKTIEQDLIQLR